MYVAKVPTGSGSYYYLRDRVTENGEFEHPYLYSYGSEAPTFFEPELVNARCENVLREIPKGSIDLILDDPPYGQTGANWDVEPDWNELCQLYHRVLDERGTLAIFGRQESLIPVYNILTHNGFDFRFDLVWAKHNSPWVSNQQPIPTHENIFVFSKSGVQASDLTFNLDDVKDDGVFRCPSCEAEINRTAYSVPRGDQRKPSTQGSWEDSFRGEGDSSRFPTSVLEFRTVNGVHPEYRGYAAQKPTKLLRWLIMAFSNRGDTVLDPHAGAASTLIASIPLCRKSLGVELDRERYEDASQRIDETVDELSDLKHASMIAPSESRSLLS